MYFETLSISQLLSVVIWTFFLYILFFFQRKKGALSLLGLLHRISVIVLAGVKIKLIKIKFLTEISDDCWGVGVLCCCVGLDAALWVFWLLESDFAAAGGLTTWSTGSAFLFSLGLLDALALALGSISTKLAPTFIFCPAGANTLLITPSNSDFSSTVTLSVSIEQMTSSTLTDWPTSIF